MTFLPRTRFVFLRLVAMLAVSITVLAACDSQVEQVFPSEPITLVVNWPAGGGMDRAGRLIAEHVRQRLDVPVAVINVSGAGGATGVRQVAESAPDGYTVGILGASLVASQYINPNANAVEDIDLIAFVGPDPAALEVRSDTGIETLDEYLAHVKANPGSMKNGNDAPGGVSHIAATLFELGSEIDLTLVPYRGYAPTVAAILSGEIESATLPVHQLIDQYESGDINILGVMAEERHFMAPDVPTFTEQGVDLVAGDWRAIYLPNGVAEDRRTYLENVFLETLADPAFQEAAELLSFTITPMGADETSAYVAEFDEALYPVLVDADLVKARHK
ncbi:MAG: Bug family tripartite tricarboxylate transporter substrate binding protein [Gammaproteobacteria bacterium]